MSTPPKKCIRSTDMPDMDVNLQEGLKADGASSANIRHTLEKSKKNLLKNTFHCLSRLSALFKNVQFCFPELFLF